MCFSVKDPFSTAKTAEILGVSQSSVKRWIDSGQMQAQKSPGGHRKVQWHDILVFAQENNINLKLDGQNASGFSLEPAKIRASVLKSLLSSDYNLTSKIMDHLKVNSFQIASIADDILWPTFKELRASCPHPSEKCNLLHCGLESLILCLKNFSSETTTHKKPYAVLADIGYAMDSLPIYLAESVAKPFFKTLQIGKNSPSEVIIGAIKEYEPKIVVVAAHGPVKAEQTLEKLKEIQAPSYSNKITFVTIGDFQKSGTLNISSFAELQGIYKILQF